VHCNEWNHTYVTTFCVRKATFFCNEFHVACRCFLTVISRSLSKLNTAWMKRKTFQMRHEMIWSSFSMYPSIMLTFTWMVSSWLFIMFKCYTHVPWLPSTHRTTKENLQNHSWKLADSLPNPFILFTPPRSK